MFTLIIYLLIAGEVKFVEVYDIPNQELCEKLSVITTEKIKPLLVHDAELISSECVSDEPTAKVYML